VRLSLTNSKNLFFKHMQVPNYFYRKRGRPPLCTQGLIESYGEPADLPLPQINEQIPGLPSKREILQNEAVLSMKRRFKDIKRELDADLKQSHPSLNLIQQLNIILDRNGESLWYPFRKDGGTLAASTGASVKKRVEKELKKMEEHYFREQMKVQILTLGERLKHLEEEMLKSNARLSSVLERVIPLIN